MDSERRAAVAGDTDTIHGKCRRAPPPWMGTAVASAMAQNKARPAYWRTLRSELASTIDVFSVPVPVDEAYGSIPLVLLRAPSHDDDVPDEIRDATEAARSQTHARLVAASTRGVMVKFRTARTTSSSTSLRPLSRPSGPCWDRNPNTEYRGQSAVSRMEWVGGALLVGGRCGGAARAAQLGFDRVAKAGLAESVLLLQGRADSVRHG